MSVTLRVGSSIVFPVSKNSQRALKSPLFKDLREESTLDSTSKWCKIWWLYLAKDKPVYSQHLISLGWSPVDCFLGHCIETSMCPDVILIPYYRKRSSYKGYWIKHSIKLFENKIYSIINFKNDPKRNPMPAQMRASSTHGRVNTAPRHHGTMGDNTIRLTHEEWPRGSAVDIPRGELPLAHHKNTFTMWSHNLWRPVDGYYKNQPVMRTHAQKYSTCASQIPTML